MSDSQASTVPGTDEEARAMAIQKFQQARQEDQDSAAKTPTEKIRRMPATPSLRKVMSDPLLHQTAPEGATQDPSKTSKTKKITGKKTKGKAAKGRKTKGKKKTMKKGKVLKPNGEKPKKTPTSEKPCAAATSTSAPPTSSQQPKPAAVAETATPVVETKVTVKEEPKAPAPAAPTASTASAVPAAPGQVQPAPVGIPASTVQSVLNRAKTGDVTQGSNLSSRPVPDPTAARLAEIASAKSGNPTDDPLRKAPKPRDKVTHNRRNRFYRSLESVLVVN